jgi:sugar-specific transcriptional regulator TrmB/DNA-binding CsgD family transcriptional regulator
VFDVIGLDSDAEVVYEALLDGGAADVRELVARTGRPAKIVRSALRILIHHGLASRRAGSPIRYGAIDPVVALDVLLLQREEQLARARAHARELAERFHNSAAMQDASELVELISGSDVIVQRVNQLERSARHELRCLDKPPYQSALTDPGEVDFLQRGGRARGIYDQDAIKFPEKLNAVRDVVAVGEEARTLRSVPTKLLLIDDRVAVVPLRNSPADPSPTFVVIHPSALLDALSGLFEVLWELALPLEFSLAADGARAGPAPDDQRILASLTAGLSDAAVARQLHISERTYQRRISNLMQRLHAHTRFQLAQQAMRRGWLG